MGAATPNDHSTADISDFAVGAAVQLSGQDRSRARVALGAATAADLFARHTRKGPATTLPLVGAPSVNTSDDRQYAPHRRTT